MKWVSYRKSVHLKKWWIKAHISGPLIVDQKGLVVEHQYDTPAEFTSWGKDLGSEILSYGTSAGA